MLFDMPSPMSSILEKFKNHRRFKFILTGSRFIGGARPDSDWDFIVEQDEGYVMDFLTELGFTIISYTDNGGADGNTNGIFERVENGVKIQVQLTPNVEAKLFARDTIKEYFFEQHLVMGQEQRAEFWKALHKVYELGHARPRPDVDDDLPF